MPTALTRAVPPTIANCELTHLSREPIDVARAIEQHAQYEQALIALGCTIHRLPPLPDLPDSVFVEDAAVVLPEIAIIARPGAPSRRPEVESVAEALRPRCPLAFIESPGTLDGGDVLRIGSMIYVGQSTRTNADGIRQLTVFASARGYDVRPVEVSGCLHLKSAVTLVADEVILLNPDWVDPAGFTSVRRIDVHPTEPFGANAVLVGNSVIYSATYTATGRLLEQEGINLMLVDMEELQKAEGAVTCCSILLAGK